MSKSLYTLGKALSNFAVLAAMVSVLAVAAVILQLVRAEGGSLEPGKLLAPFIWVALPAMAMTAAVAVLFETLPVLRGGVGNVIYFFAWASYVGVSGVTGVNDYLGLGFFMRQMVGALKLIDPSYRATSRCRPDPPRTPPRRFFGTAWNGLRKCCWPVCNGWRSLSESLGCPRFSSTASIRRGRVGTARSKRPSLLKIGPAQTGHRPPAQPPSN